MTDLTVKLFVQNQKEMEAELKPDKRCNSMALRYKSSANTTRH